MTGDWRALVEKKSQLPSCMVREIDDGGRPHVTLVGLAKIIRRGSKDCLNGKSTFGRR